MVIDRANPPLWRRASTAAVLQYVWDAGAVCTDDIIDAVKLTRSTAIAAINALIELRLVEELDNARTESGYRLGRPSRRFRFRDQAGLVVGVDAGRTRVTATVANLLGEPLSHHHRDISPGQDNAEARRAAVDESILRALEGTGRNGTEVISVAIGVPAPVDANGRSPAHREGFWERMNPGFQEHLKSRFPTVRVENDGALAALAEGSSGAAQGSGNFVALLAGMRLGAGVVVDGKLLRGVHGGAPELGIFGQVEGIGTARGFGDLVDEWVREAIAHGQFPADHPLTSIASNDLSARTEFAHIRADDPATRPIVERAGTLLARICKMLCGFYDPERVVLCGAVAEAMTDVIAFSQQQLASETELPCPQIIGSALGGDVVSVGAVAAALEGARSVVLPLLGKRHSDHSRPVPGIESSPAIDTGSSSRMDPGSRLHPSK